MSLSSTGGEGSHILRGIGLRIVSAFCFSLMGGLLKLASTRGAAAHELVFYRSLFGLPVVLLWVLLGEGLRVLKPRSVKAHAGRAALGLAAMGSGFVALTRLPLAEATTINFTAPVFAVLLSWLLFREHLLRHRLIAVVVGFLSVIIITRPGATSAAISGVGVVLGLIGAVLTATVHVALRHLLNSERVAAIVFWFLAAGTVAGLVLLLILGSSADRTAIAILALAGTIGGIAQICMTASLQAAPISALSPFDYLQLVGALVLGWLLFATSPTFNTIAGVLMIASSGLYMGWREHRLRRKELVTVAEAGQI